MTTTAIGRPTYCKTCFQNHGNCICAPSMPAPSWYSPQDKPMELEPSNPEPVQPSSQPGARVSAAIAKTTDLAGQLAHALRVIDGLLDAMGTQAASLDTFRTDMRQCAMLDRQENNYIARRRPKAPMGS